MSTLNLGLKKSYLEVGIFGEVKEVYKELVRVRVSNLQLLLAFNKFFSITGKIVDFNQKEFEKLIVLPTYLNQILVCEKPSSFVAFESKVRIKTHEDSVDIKLNVLDLSTQTEVARLIVNNSILKEAEPIPLDAFTTYIFQSSLWLAGSYLERYMRLESGNLLKRMLVEIESFVKTALSSHYLI
ncbi:hypothetical protein [Fervidobacterium sp.]